MWEGDLWVAVRAARAGAYVVRRGFDEAFDFEMKGDVDPVTDIDRESEAAVTDVIRSHFPTDSILAEEGGGEADWRGPRVWIIDPLDGTVNFVHGIPQVAVSVALWDNGEPVVGVVIDVIREEEFVAVVGTGARCNDRPIQVSNTAALKDSLLATGLPYDRQQHARGVSRSHGGRHRALSGQPAAGRGRSRHGLGGVWPVRRVLGARRAPRGQALGRGGRESFWSPKPGERPRTTPGRSTSSNRRPSCRPTARSMRNCAA